MAWWEQRYNALTNPQAKTSSSGGNVWWSDRYNYLKTQPSQQPQSVQPLNKPLTFPIAGNVGVGTNTPQSNTFQTLTKEVGNIANKAWNNFLVTSPIGAVIQGKPQEFLPRIKQTVAKQTENPEDLAMNFSPAGATTKLSSAIAKEVKPQVIKGFLQKTFTDIGDDVAEAFSKKLAPITDSKIVQEEIDTFMKTKLPVGKEIKINKQLEQGMQKTAQQPDLAESSSIAIKARPVVEQAKNLQEEAKTVMQEARKQGQASDLSIAQMPKAQDEIISSFKGSTPKQKVNFVDYLRTPYKVLEKIGLGKEAQLLKQKYRDYIIDLPKEIDKVTKWAKRASDKGAEERIFKYLDGQEVQLQGEELQVANEIKQYLKQWADKLKLPEDKRITNYITHIFDEDLIKKEFDPELAKLIADKVPGSVYDPFLLERYGIPGYKQDVWQALDAYVKRGTRKFHMDQALEPLQKASEMLDLESLKYVKRLADRVNLRPTEVDSLIDNFIKSTPIGYKLGGRPVARVSRFLRQIVYRGTLGLNIGSAFRNLTQGANTYAKLGEKYTIKGYYDMIKDVLRRGNELKEVGVLADNIVQDRYLNATKKFWEKADKGLFSFFSAAERINRGAAYFGGKAKALAKGATEEEAIKAGIKTVEDTQFVFGSVDTPVALQNDIVKVLTQFQSFNVKQSEFLTEMIKNKEFGGLIRFAGANVAMYLTIGKLFGMKPTDMIPFFSNITQGRFATPPIQAVGGVIKSVTGNEDQKEEGMTELKKIAPAFIPAGVQAKKTIEGVGAYQQGASTTPSGRTRFEVEKTPENLLKSAIFGQYTLPGADEYFKNLGKPKAEIIYNEITKLKTKQERIDAWNKMVKDGVITEGNVSDVQQWFKDKEIGTTDQERKWRSLGVEDGSRARVVTKEILKLKTNKERVDYVNSLIEKKVVTDKVLEQVQELINTQSNKQSSAPDTKLVGQILDTLMGVKEAKAFSTEDVLGSATYKGNGQVIHKPGMVQKALSWLTGGKKELINPYISSSNVKEAKPKPSPVPQTEVSPEAIAKVPKDNNYPGRKVEVTPPPENIASIIKKYFPENVLFATVVAASENAGYDPKVKDNVNSNGSVDRGLFQVNDRTFNGLMERAGDLLKQKGITSFEDMYDPDKNAFVAKLIQEGSKLANPKTNGWGAWFGWQDTGYDINNGYFSKPERIRYELKKRGRIE